MLLSRLSPRRTFLRVFAPTLALAALSVAPAAAQIAEGFVQMVRCPNDGFQPRLAVDAERVIHLVVLRGDPAAADLAYVQSKDAGASFSEPIRVNTIEHSVDGSSGFRGANLALGPDGVVHVAWLGMADGSGAPERRPVFYARLAKGASAFEPQQNLVRSRYGMDAAPAIAVSSSDVFVFWHAPGDELMPVEEQTGKGKRENKTEEDSAEDEEREPAAEGAAQEPPRPLRRVWLAASSDGGASFSEEKAVDPDPNGASPGCAMSAAVDREGSLFVFYRIHTGRQRDMRFLTSDDRGATFNNRYVDIVKSRRDSETGCALTLGPRGLLAAWENKGTVIWARVRKDTERIKGPMAPKELEGWAVRPALAENSKGALLLAWLEGTQEEPKELVWQLFASVERRSLEQGRQAGIDPSTTPAVFARPDDGFTIFY